MKSHFSDIVRIIIQIIDIVQIPHQRRDVFKVFLINISVENHRYMGVGDDD